MDFLGFFTFSTGRPPLPLPRPLPRPRVGVFRGLASSSSDSEPSSSSSSSESSSFGLDFLGTFLTFCPLPLPRPEILGEKI